MSKQSKAAKARKAAVAANRKRRADLRTNAARYSAGMIRRNAQLRARRDVQEGKFDRVAALIAERREQERGA